MRPLATWLIVLLFSCVSGATRSFAALERGTLAGAHYTAAVPDAPAAWNGHLLLIAHGYRPETAPLVADLSLQNQAYRTLVNEGWIVAKTSYRRNGLIVADAITDLDTLVAHLRRTHGNPTRIIVEGDSMGGLIATLMAERGSPLDGAIAIGAALDLREPGGATGVSFSPRVPLLFIANRSEIAGPIAYVTTTGDRDSPDRIDPVLFRIDRDGHVNVNQAERLFAIRQLNRWLDEGRTVPPTPPRQANPQLPASYFDATQAAEPGPSKVEMDTDRRGFATRVVDVSAIYGNVWLDAQPADFAAAGIEPGTWFQLTVGADTYRVRYGRDFSSVERGQWVAFPNADGFFWLSRNYANAAETAGLTLGDTVRLRRFDDEAKP